nr:MAG TPA: hypothetical protein [Caudoviricetes sp.]
MSRTRWFLRISRRDLPGGENFFRFFVKAADFWALVGKRAEKQFSRTFNN